MWPQIRQFVFLSHGLQYHYYKVLKGPLESCCQNRIVSLTDEGIHLGSIKGRTWGWWRKPSDHGVVLTLKKGSLEQKSLRLQCILRKLLSGYGVSPSQSHPGEQPCAGQGQATTTLAWLSVAGNCPGRWRAWPQHKGGEAMEQQLGLSVRLPTAGCLQGDLNSTLAWVLQTLNASFLVEGGEMQHMRQALRHPIAKQTHIQIIVQY